MAEFLSAMFIDLPHQTPIKKWTRSNSPPPSILTNASAPPSSPTSSHDLHSALNLDSGHPVGGVKTDDPAGERIPDISHLFVTSDVSSPVPSTTPPPIGLGTSHSSSMQCKHKHPPWLDIQSTRQEGHGGSTKPDLSSSAASFSLPLESDVFANSERIHSSDADTLVPSKKTPASMRIPFELLLQIFSQLTPPPISSSAHFSAGHTVATLHSCASVCKRWNAVATRLLYRKPVIYSTTKFSAFVSTMESGKTYNYLSLLSHMSLSPTLPEPSRHNSQLSPYMSRLLTLPNIALTTLDISFCKGISNYTLQKCAGGLRGLQSLNLSGGGRSEICVIRIARECGPTLKRFGLSWNGHLGDFSVREIGRLCTKLEWIDLSGCWRVGDAGVCGLARGGGRLKYVSLSYCTSVTGVGVQEVLERCGETLEVLNVVGCGDVGLGRYVVDTGLSGIGSEFSGETSAGLDNLGMEPGWRRVVVNLPGFVPF